MKNTCNGYSDCVPPVFLKDIICKFFIFSMLIYMGKAFCYTNKCRKSPFLYINLFYLCAYLFQQLFL